MKLISKLKQNIKEMKEADEIVKSEYDTEEDKKEDKIVRITLIILGILLLILFIVIILAIKTPIYKVFKTYSNLDNPNAVINSDNPYINGNTTTNTYKKYKIGDVVTLKNNTKWYVIQDSDENEPIVILLNPNNINDGSLNYQNVDNYLDTTYKNSIATSLKTDITSITTRLISLYDLSILSGIPEEQLDVGSTISNNKTPKFIYETQNMTNYLDEENRPVLICPNNGTAVLCSGNPPLNAWVVKPVIEIPKDFIK